ncbi:hypothetical protein R3P38DRAFT_2986250 [Favolaschia claudopus]|uniref:SAM domain-containing protein n=1 Tax=Favolaschia claudopus TaxID=2862362 RepID=A0AAW0AW38_9AGAR
MSLNVWRNPTVFVKALQEIFDGNEELTTMIISHRYRIQDRDCSVYRLGSPLVSAGAEIFMAAILYRESTKEMSCPYCKAEVPVLPGCNLQTSMDCNHCQRRFSSSQAALLSSLQTEAHGSPTLPKESLKTAIDTKLHQPLTRNSNPLISNTSKTTTRVPDISRTAQIQTTSQHNLTFMKFVHLLLLPPALSGDYNGDQIGKGVDSGEQIAPKLSPKPVWIEIDSASVAGGTMNPARFCKTYDLGDDIRKLLEDEGFELVCSLFEIEDSKLLQWGFPIGPIAEIKWALKKMFHISHPEACIARAAFVRAAINEGI